MATKYDAIVIGGGLNGLVTAAYLAKGGEKDGRNKLKVLVLERYHKVGGAAMSEEINPGFTYSYLLIWMLSAAAGDLPLSRSAASWLAGDPL